MEKRVHLNTTISAETDRLISVSKGEKTPGQVIDGLVLEKLGNPKRVLIQKFNEMVEKARYMGFDVSWELRDSGRMKE
jgi:hypothetical protein